MLKICIYWVLTLQQSKDATTAKDTDKIRIEDFAINRLMRLFKCCWMYWQKVETAIFLSYDWTHCCGKKEYPVFNGLSSVRVAIVARSRECDRYLCMINPMNFHCAALRGLPCGCSIFSGLFIWKGDARLYLQAMSHSRNCETCTPSYIACSLPFLFVNV